MSNTKLITKLLLPLFLFTATSCAAIAKEKKVEIEEEITISSHHIHKEHMKHHSEEAKETIKIVQDRTKDLIVAGNDMIKKGKGTEDYEMMHEGAHLIKIADKMHKYLTIGHTNSYKHHKKTAHNHKHKKIEIEIDEHKNHGKVCNKKECKMMPEKNLHNHKHGSDKMMSEKHMKMMEEHKMLINLVSESSIDLIKTANNMILEAIEEKEIDHLVNGAELLLEGLEIHSNLKKNKHHKMMKHIKIMKKHKCDKEKCKIQH